MLTQPIKWHGGKHYLANWILSFAPDHVHYVEPYFGGGSVLLAKDYGTSEYINDINENLTCFWKAVQSSEMFHLLREWTEATPMSEVEFERAQSILRSGEKGRHSTLQRAWAFFVVARQSRQGLMRDFATMSRSRTRRQMNEQASSWLTAIEGLPAIHERLRGVVITCKDAIKVIEQQDSPDTWFYLDPPYLHESRVSTSAYDDEMDTEQHELLLSTLSRLQGKFSLSGYPSDLYEEYSRTYGWRCEGKEIDNKSSGKKTKETKHERLWMNY